MIGEIASGTKQSIEYQLKRGFIGRFRVNIQNIRFHESCRPYEASFVRCLSEDFSQEPMYPFLSSNVLSAMILNPHVINSVLQRIQNEDCCESRTKAFKGLTIEESAELICFGGKQRIVAAIESNIYEWGVDLYDGI